MDGVMTDSGFGAETRARASQLFPNAAQAVPPTRAGRSDGGRLRPSERLVPRLGGRVPHQTIEEEARQTYRSLVEGARIHDFIPILGERDVFLRFRNRSA